MNASTTTATWTLRSPPKDRRMMIKAPAIPAKRRNITIYPLILWRRRAFCTHQTHPRSANCFARKAGAYVRLTYRIAGTNWKTARKPAAMAYRGSKSNQYGGQRLRLDATHAGHRPGEGRSQSCRAAADTNTTPRATHVMTDSPRSSKEI